MSNLLSGRGGGVWGLISVTAVVCALPMGGASARACDVLSSSFHCMTGTGPEVAAPKIKARKASLAPLPASDRIVRPSRRPALIGRRPATSKRRGTRTASRRARLRKAGRLHRIGSRYSLDRARRQSRKTSRRGWRTRSRALGYSVVSRSVVTRCFPARLRALLRKVSAHYGRQVRITSGFRSRRHNRRIGGARRSQHIHCTAADFYVPGVNKYALARYVKGLRGRGGVGTYCGNNTVHLDVGPRRSWHWSCGRRHKRRIARKLRRTKRVSRAKRTDKRKRAAVRFRGSKV